MNNSVSTFENHIQIPPGSIYVKRWQSLRLNTQTPIVLLHDSLGSVEMWRDFPQALSEATGRTVYAYDRLGFGRSSKRDQRPSVRFVTEEAETYLPELLKALSVDQFVLFGHSVGGGMAIVSAGYFGSRCKAVITESAQAFVEDRTREGIEAAKIIFANPKVFEKLQKYHGDKTAWVLDAWIGVWLSEDFAPWSLREDLPKMTCPMMVIHGDKDEYGSLKFPEMIYDLAGGPKEKHIISECGHVPHREKPELILQLTASFLEPIS